MPFHERVPFPIRAESIRSLDEEEALRPFSERVGEDDVSSPTTTKPYCNEEASLELVVDHQEELPLKAETTQTSDEEFRKMTVSMS